MCVAADQLPQLDFTEVLKDSPRFRNSVFDRIIKLLKFSSLSIAINQLCNEMIPQDPSLLLAIKSLSEAFLQIFQLYKLFIEQSHQSISSNINGFMKNERQNVSETRTHFESLSNSLDEALAKRAAVNRSRSVELTDARNSLTAVGTCFAHSALDYAAQISMAHAQKDYTVVHALWTFVNECASFFSRGHSFFTEWTACESGAVIDSVSLLERKSKQLKRKMQDRHALVPKEVFLHPAGMSPEDDVVMEGYLFKRSTNAFKTWHRRWFQIKHNKLIYSHRSDEVETPRVMEDDLKLCLVRPAPPTFDRTCCFELVTPTKSHMLQADSDMLCSAWMRALQRTIHHLHECDDVAVVPSVATTKYVDCSGSESNRSSIKSTGSLLNELRCIAGNEFCADCGANTPKWASINLGVLLCIECCGIHRSFGVQISKVRSLVMDTFEPEHKKLLLALGNRLVNSVYLANVPGTQVLPSAPNSLSARSVKEVWIRAKYVERSFVRKNDRAAACSVFDGVAGNNIENTAHSTQQTKPPGHVVLLSRCTSEPSTYPKFNKEEDGYINIFTRSILSAEEIKSQGNENIDSRAYMASTSGNLLAMFQLVAEGFDVNTDIGGTTALHIAAEHGHSLITEFLLLNGARINTLDSSLNSPLHIASKYARTLVVCQLVKRGADHQIRNLSDETPLDIAINGKHADIVTLLRLREMRQEFCDEFDNPMDETVDDVMHDISRKIDPTFI